MKKINKNINLFVSLFFALFLCLTFVSCKEKKDEDELLALSLQEKFNQNLEDAKKLTVSYQTKDNDIVVYENTITLIIDSETKENAQLIIKESILNNKFELDSNSETTDLTNINRKDYINVTFDKQYFTEIIKEETEVKLVVKSYFLESYLGYQDMTNLSKSANSVVTIEEENISSIVTTYLSDSGKDITIAMNFNY